MIRKIMVVGAKGFLGTYVCNLLATEFSIVECDLPEVDITESSLIQEFIIDHNPDAIVHLAAMTGAKLSMLTPSEFVDVNVKGTINILEACKNADVKNIVFISSLTVHGRVSETVTESTAISPQHLYGATKAAAEIVVRTYSNAYQLNSICLRPNLITGAGKTEEDLIYDFVKSIRSGEPVKVYGSGQHTRQWTHPSDIATAVLRSIENIECPFNVFCIGSNCYSALDVAKKIIEHEGRGTIMNIEAQVESFTLACSPRLFEQQTGWKAQIGIDQIIKEVSDDVK